MAEIREAYYVVTNTIGEGQMFYSRMRRIESQGDGVLQIVDSKHGISRYRHAWQLFDEKGGAVVKMDYSGSEHMMAVDITIISENLSQRKAALTTIEKLTEIKLLEAIPATN